jgi:hypothetical protein
MHNTAREDWSVEGPLEVTPDQEDNYAQEASAICVVGGSSGETTGCRPPPPPPVHEEIIPLLPTGI